MQATDPPPAQSVTPPLLRAGKAAASEGGTNSSMLHNTPSTLAPNQKMHSGVGKGQRGLADISPPAQSVTTPPYIDGVGPEGGGVTQSQIASVSAEVPCLVLALCSLSLSSLSLSLSLSLSSLIPVAT
jgi:hypothetical protein